MMQEQAHLTDEQISAFIDEELTEPERAAARDHFGACSICTDQAERLRSVARSISSLAEVEVDADTHRAIRQAVLRQTKSAGARRWRLVAASTMAVLVVSGGVWFATGQRTQPASEMAAGSRRGPQERSFDTEAEVRDAVIKDPAVIKGLESYRVRDVGETQERLAIGETTAGSGAASSGAADEKTADSEGGYKASSAAPQTLTAAVPVTQCLSRVIASQPYPMVPLVTTDARFKGTPAWLFVFAWTTSTADDARLDRLQIWLVGRNDCATLSFAQLKP